MALPLIVVAGIVAVGLLLLAEHRRQAGNIRLWKMTAAGLYLAYALSLGALESTYGLLVLAALGLSAVGDAFLLFDKKPAFFLAGLVAFLCAHLGYVAALYVYGWSTGVVVALYPVLGVLAYWFIWRSWLGPRLPADMRIPVLVYVMVILAMVAAAAGVSWRHGAPAFWVAAVMFAVSDLAVARQQFIVPAFTNKVWGLPLYFAAQFLFASTLG